MKVNIVNMNSKLVATFLLTKIVCVTPMVLHRAIHAVHMYLFKGGV